MKKALLSLWTNEFYQGGFFITVSSFLVNFLNYFFSLFAARSLGPSGFGEITALLSYVSIFSLPVAILSSIIIQKISAAGANRSNYSLSLEQLFVDKIKKLFLLFSPLLLVIPFLPRITNLSSLSSYSLVLLIILALISSFYIAANQGLRLFFLSAVVGVGAAILKCAGAILSYFHFDGIATIISFLIVSSLFSIIASYVFFHNTIRRKIQTLSPKIERSIVSIFSSKQFLIFALSITGISFFGTIDIIFVKKFFSPNLAGIYSSWSLFAKIILYALGPLISLSFIFFSSSDTKNNQNKVLKISLILLVIVGIISYFVYSQFATFLTNLIFGNRFQSVTPYLAIASIFGSFFAGITFINNYFLSRKHFASLILPFGLPLYILVLFLIPKTIIAVMQLTTVFSIVVMIIYLLVFFLV